MYFVPRFLTLWYTSARLDPISLAEISMRDLRRHAVIVIIIGLIGFSALARRPRFEQIHTVDVLQLLVSGACFGIGLTLLFSRLLTKP
jgi:hypothetical protein